MKDFLETLQALENTPVPNLFIIVGFLFITLAFVGKIGAFIELSSGRQKWAGIIGFLFLVIGSTFFVLPKIKETPTPPISIIPPTTPTHPIKSATIVDDATLNIELGGQMNTITIVEANDNDEGQNGIYNISSQGQNRTFFLGRDKKSVVNITGQGNILRLSKAIEKRVSISEGGQLNSIQIIQ